jgi:hypothetical protein
MNAGAGVPEKVNPYAAPAAKVDDVPADPQAARVRMEHIGREASIQSLGTLYYFAAGIAVLGLFVFVSGPGMDEMAGAKVVGVVVAGAVVCAALVVLGRGLRMLKPWTRAPACVLAAIGLLAFPVGTLVNAYILWMLLSAKGRTVLTAEYAEVVDATPDIQYRRSRLLSIVFLLFVAFFVLALFLVLV